VVVDDTLPAREAFRLAEADFSIAARPVFDADMQPIAGYQAITRLDSGRTLSVMAESYTPIQNEALIYIAESQKSLDWLSEFGDVQKTKSAIDAILVKTRSKPA